MVTFSHKCTVAFTYHNHWARQHFINFQLLYLCWTVSSTSIKLQIRVTLHVHSRNLLKVLDTVRHKCNLNPTQSKVMTTTTALYLATFVTLFTFLVLQFYCVILQPNSSCLPLTSSVHVPAMGPEVQMRFTSTCTMWWSASRQVHALQDVGRANTNSSN